MFGLSLPEIIFLAILALVVIGPKQLPEVARTLGRVLNELRRASSSLTEEFRQQVKINSIRLEDQKPQQPPVSAHEPMSLEQDQVFDNNIKPEVVINSEDSEVKKS